MIPKTNYGLLLKESIFLEEQTDKDNEDYSTGREQHFILLVLHSDSIIITP